MKNITLKTRIIITLLATTFIGGFFICWLIGSYDLNEHKKQIELEKNIQLSAIKSSITEIVILGDYATLQQVLNEFIVNPNMQFISFTNKNNIQINAFKENIQSEYPKLFGLVLNTPSKIVATKEIDVGGEKYGTIEIALDNNSFLNTQWTRFKYIALILFGVLGFQSFIFLYFLKNKLLPSLDAIQKCSTAIGNGQKANFNNNDVVTEVKQVIESFNEMADAIENQKHILMEQARELEEKNFELDAMNEELLTTNEAISEQAKELIENEAKLLLSQQIAQIADWVFHIQNQTFDASASMQKIFGFKNPIFSLDDFISKIHDDDIWLAKEIFDKNNNIQKHNKVLRLKQNSSEVRYIHIQSEYFYQNSIPINIIGIAQDITDLKQTELNLQELLKEQEALLKVESAGFFRAKNRVFTWVSDSMAKMLGYETSELTNQDAKIVYSSYNNYISQGKEIYAKLSNNMACEIELHAKRKDGSTFWMLVNFTPIKDSPGETLGIIIDITNLKTLNQKIKEETDFVNTIFDTPDTIMAVIDRDGTMIRFNKYAEEFTGYSRQEISKQPMLWAKLLLPEQQANINEIFENARNNKIKRRYENYWISKNGMARLFDWYNATITDSEGKMTYLVTIGVDITEQKKNQKEVLEQKKILSDFVENASSLIYIKDTNGIYQLINKQFENRLQVTRAQAIGKTDFDIFDEKIATEISNNDKIVIMQDQAKEFEEVLSFDGAEFLYLSIKFPIKDADSNIVGVCCISYDITERKQLETELKNLNKHLNDLVQEETNKRIEQERLLLQQSRLATMGEMISNIAHQWRQPLNQISILKDTLVDDYFFKDLNDEKVEKFSKTVSNSLTYMSQTIDDFRNFFKPDKEKKEFNINENIKTAVSLVNDALKSSNIILKLNEQEANINIIGYPSEFSQVILNIINNAKDALKTNNDSNNRYIYVKTYKQDLKAIVKIIDNAGGISENIISKIFDPYFTTKAKSQGTGLGLYMSKMIIEQNIGGKLYVYNENNGACFVIETTLA